MRITLPARINVVGSPTDAVEGAYATISAAVELRGGAEVREADDLCFERAGGETRHFDRGVVADPDGFDVEAAAVNALLSHSPEFAEKIEGRGVAMRTWTEIPASSGMAGSSVLVLAVLAGLREHYDLDRRRHNDYVLAE